MALETLSAIANALAEQFHPDLFTQWNRISPTARDIPAEPGRGKTAAWDVEFSGSVDAATVAEGSDVTAGEFDSDVDVPGTLAWAHYRKSFQISETALDAAASSMATPQALVSLFGQRLLGAGARIARKINYDMWNGTGTDGSGNSTIVGYCGGALAASGTYAGINRATYSEWQGNVLGNGGTPRALTLDLLYQAEEAIYGACGEESTIIRTTPGVLRKYAGLFEEGRRLETGTDEYRAGARQLYFRGLPVVRDSDAPAGKLVFENRNYVSTKVLPRIGQPEDSVRRQMQAATGKSGSVITTTAIPLRVALLAKTGDSIKCSAKASVAMCVFKPRAFCLVEDISEA